MSLVAQVSGNQEENAQELARQGEVDAGSSRSASRAQLQRLGPLPEAAVAEIWREIEEAVDRLAGRAPVIRHEPSIRRPCSRISLWRTPAKSRSVSVTRAGLGQSFPPGSL